MTIERDYLSMYRRLFSRLPPRSKSFTVQEAETMAKSWFHSRIGRPLVVLDSIDIIDNTDDAWYIDLKWLLPDALRVDFIITTRGL
jgi:hypothetical protein